MPAFLLYLFETVLCLSLLYTAYWLFLRKETFFSFNRLFLIGSLLLALLVPLLHINFLIPGDSLLEGPAKSIVSFRSYYTDIIRQTNADFGKEPGKTYSSPGWNGPGQKSLVPADPEWGTLPRETLTNRISPQKNGANKNVSYARLFLVLYICGVLYFLIRFIYLVVRLFLLAARNGIKKQDGFRMVEIDEDISPFSFFRFLFINPSSFSATEFQEVLEHEKAHIRQKHSFDHLLAQGMAVFQWFNPLAWQFRTALKTTHEYIADHQVLRKGFEPHEYQALLIQQMIGYHSVELVNNFNLKPIKKRIAMMNKTRSGIPAKMKALLVLPITIIAFLLFADFTLADNGSGLIRLSGNRGSYIQKDLNGLWVNTSDDQFSNLISFSPDRFSCYEDGAVSSYFWKTDKDFLELSTKTGYTDVSLKMVLTGNRMTLWWNDDHATEYTRSAATNSLDYFLSEEKGLTVDLPAISRFRLLEKERLVFRISIGYTKDRQIALAVDGKTVKPEQLPGILTQKKSSLSKLEVRELTALFLVDKEIPMRELEKIRNVLREAGILKFAEGGYPATGNNTVSPLLYHTIGLPRLLPPPDAKIIDVKELSRDNADLFEINLSARNSSPAEIDRRLNTFIKENDSGKYVLLLKYDRDIPYGQYVESVDLLHNVIYKFRDLLATTKYHLSYDQLGEELQREVKNRYPVALSEVWTD